jgi:hypothetical protein
LPSTKKLQQSTPAKQAAKAWKTSQVTEPVAQAKAQQEMTSTLLVSKELQHRWSSFTIITSIRTLF